MINVPYLSGRPMRTHLSHVYPLEQCGQCQLLIPKSTIMFQGQLLTGNFFVSLLQLSRRLEHLHKLKGIQIMSLPYTFGYSRIQGTSFEPQTTEEKVETISFTFYGISFHSPVSFLTPSLFQIREWHVEFVRQMS